MATFEAMLVLSATGLRSQVAEMKTLSGQPGMDAGPEAESCKLPL